MLQTTPTVHSQGGSHRGPDVCRVCAVCVSTRSWLEEVLIDVYVPVVRCTGYRYSSLNPPYETFTFLGVPPRIGRGEDPVADASQIHLNPPVSSAP